MMNVWAWVVLLVALVGAGRAQAGLTDRADEAGWKTFSIPEFGTQVEYPAAMFSVQEGQPERGIGQRFQTGDGRASFSIYARANEAGETPASYLRNNLRRPRSRLQYQRVTPTFFAISEESKEIILYSRCNFSKDDAIHCFDLVYPRREKRAWDAIVTRISRSLRPLQR